MKRDGDLDNNPLTRRPKVTELICCPNKRWLPSNNTDLPSYRSGSQDPQRASLGSHHGVGRAAPPGALEENTFLRLFWPPQAPALLGLWPLPPASKPQSQRRSVYLTFRPQSHHVPPVLCLLSTLKGPCDDTGLTRIIRAHLCTWGSVDQHPGFCLQLEFPFVV